VVAAVALASVAALVGFFVLAIAMPLETPEVPSATTILDIRNRVAARLFTEHRVEVALEDIPHHFRNAIVAAEDERFFGHAGLDPVALGRAMVRNLQAGRIVEGGSTITQQLAKNLFLSPERTVARKLQEALVTVRLERSYDKQRILELYINQIYWGHGAYGAQVASQTYFGKDVWDLTLAESALLAGIVRGPENLSPYRNLEVAVARRRQVLESMVRLGFVGAQAAGEALNEPIRLSGLRQDQNMAPYFVEYVIHSLAEALPDISEADIWRGGYVIRTTMDLDMQMAAQNAVAAGLPPGTMGQGGVEQPQGALVAIDPSNGHIRALVGGREYSQSTWNRAWRARRQPGSAFKPFVYVAALDMGFSPAHLQRCEPITFTGPVPGEEWAPGDYGEDKYHHRSMAMREALRISDNVVAVKWADTVGTRAVIHYARKMGVRSPLEADLSLALGTSSVTPLELAAAYCPLANGGDMVRPLAILSVEDLQGRVLHLGNPTREGAIDERVAFLVTSLLKSVFDPGGTGAHISLDRPASGKTGTSSELKDAWFVGYTPDLVTAVYVGDDDPSRSLEGGGGTLAGPIWEAFMRNALVGRPPRDFPAPSGIVSREICADTGRLVTPACPRPYTEYFAEGTAPREYCPGPHPLTLEADAEEPGEPEPRLVAPEEQPPEAQGIPPEGETGEEEDAAEPAP
jgi:1A family penicillin-binding protein